MKQDVQPIKPSPKEEKVKPGTKFSNPTLKKRKLAPRLTQALNAFGPPED